MACSIKTRRIRGVVLVDMLGRFSIGEPVLLLRNTIRGLADEDSSKFVLNLEGVPYVDSCGLGELVATYKSLMGRECTMSLLRPTQRIADLLELTKLSTVFDVFEDENRAVEAQLGSGATTN